MGPSEERKKTPQGNDQDEVPFDVLINTDLGIERAEALQAASKAEETGDKKVDHSDDPDFGPGGILSLIHI